jgi:nicotinate phosphoribosyltransferase
MTDTAPSPALFADLYELTMAQAYWRSGTTAPATFSLFVRAYPPDRGYFIAAGLEGVLDYLEHFRFTPADLDSLHGLGRFNDQFLDVLAGLRFTGDVRALPEGTVFFVNEPVLEVTAPVIEAQLVETFLVNQVNVQTLLATKAARVRHAARDRQVIDFAARRCHGTEAADLFARAGYLAGFDGTSNTRAGARFGIPVSGTMAHSFVCCYPSEAESFRQFARSFPDATILLVDTYDTVAGVRKAAAVAAELRRQGHELRAVRLDSGDLRGLSVQARRILDEAGLPGVKVFASGGLDEYEVDELLRAGAPIDGFGVGTRVGVSADAPLTDCAYKLVQYAGRPVLKLSPKKQTLPGPKQVYRYRGAAGQYDYDVIAGADEPAPLGAEPMLTPVMARGKRLQPAEPLATARERFRREFAALPDGHKALRSPARYEVRVSSRLEALTRHVVEETKRREVGSEQGGELGSAGRPGQ